MEGGNGMSIDTTHDPKAATVTVEIPVHLWQMIEEVAHRDSRSTGRILQTAITRYYRSRSL